MSDRPGRTVSYGKSDIMGRSWIAAVVVGTAALSARAGYPEPRQTPLRTETVEFQEQDPKGKEPPKGPPAKEPPKAKTPPKKDVPEPDAFARGPDMGGEAPAGSFSRMMGDWVGAIYADSIVQLPGYQVTVTEATTTMTQIVTRQGANGQLIRVPVTTVIPLGNVVDVKPTLVTTRARVPILSGGAFKIAENERPLPEDRVFLTYNYFAGVPGASQAPLQPTPTMVEGQTALTAGIIPPLNTVVQRQVVGFETTFLDGFASFGMRAPFVQQQGDGSVASQDFGDLSFVFKMLAYSFGSDGIAGGLVVTVPTGPVIHTVQGDVRPFLFQPWVGGVASAGDVFGMVFASVVLPTDDRYPTMLLTDLQVGYMAYQSPGGPVTFVAPMAEIHMTNPLTNRSPSSLMYVPDLLVLTQGVQVGFGMATFSVGIAYPVSGPKPFDWEALVQLNVRF